LPVLVNICTTDDPSPFGSFPISSEHERDTESKRYRKRCKDDDDSRLELSAKLWVIKLINLHAIVPG